MNQHYLPVFYLKHFTDPATPADQEPYVWVFQGDKWKKKAPSNIACAANYYAFEDQTGEVNHLFESKLQELESLAAPTLSKIAGRLPHTVTGAERVFISYLLVSMQQRTPVFLNSWADEIERLVKWQYRMCFDSLENAPPKFEKFKSHLRASNSPNSFANISMDQVTPDKFDQWSAKPVNAFTLSQLMKSWTDLSGLIYSMNWVLLYADSPVFVTSEAPVVSIAPLPDGSWTNCDFRHKNVDVSFPLTSKRTLMCSWRGSESYRLVKASENDIRTVNLRTINNAALRTPDNPTPIEIIAASRNFPLADVVEAVSFKRCGSDQL